MNKEGKIDPDKIFFLSILTIKGSIESGEQESFEKSKAYEFEFSSTISIERSLEQVQVVLGITIISVSEPGVPTGVKASYTNKFVFYVANLEDLVDFKEDTKKAVIHANLGGTLLSMAYGTMRGIIYIRTQGTIVEGVILPVIDPKILLAPQADSVVDTDT